MKSRKNKKKVYVVFAADILHEGHINNLSRAAKYGDVVVDSITSRKQVYGVADGAGDFIREKIIYD